MGALSREPDATTLDPRWLSILAVVSGLLALAVGLLAGGLFLVLAPANRQAADTLGASTISVSLTALGVGFGGALTWAGYQHLRGRAARPFRPRPGWFWGCLAGAGGALLIGQLIISLDLLAPLAFPVFHILGMSLPAIAMLLLLGRAVRPNASAPTQGQMIGQMALGAFGMTAISSILEVLAVVVALVVAGMVTALTPRGLASLDELQGLLADPGRLADPRLLADWLLKPGVLLGAVVLLTVAIPSIEEGAKSLGVPLLALGTRARPSPVQGWLWGAAVGAGFAVAEGLFNGAVNLPFWAGVALMRVGASAMHIVTAGLTGLGWTRVLARRNVLPLLGTYLGSVTLHGAWNGLTLLVVVASLWAMAEAGDAARAALGGIGVALGIAGLILVIAIIAGVAACVTRRLGEQSGNIP